MLYAKFNPRDWQDGTADMRRVDRATYHDLLAEMYRQGGPIKLSPVSLAEVLRCSQSNAYTLLRRLIALGKIQRTKSGHLFNYRAMREIAFFLLGRARKAILFAAEKMVKAAAKAKQIPWVKYHIERKNKKRASSKSLWLPQDKYLAKANAERAKQLEEAWHQRKPERKYRA